MVASLEKSVTIPNPGCFVLLTVGFDIAVSDTLYRLLRYYLESDIVYAEIKNEHTGDISRRTINSFLVNFTEVKHGTE